MNADDDPPPPKKPKVPKKPPRASWEPPDPDEDVAGPTERVPVIIEANAPTQPTAPTSNVPAATTSGAFSAPPSDVSVSSGAYSAPTDDAPGASTTSGAYSAPTDDGPAPGASTTSGAYSAPTAASDAAAAYTGEVPATYTEAATTSGAYGTSDPVTTPDAPPSGGSHYAYDAGAYGELSAAPRADVDDPLAPVSSADDALRLAAGVKPLRKRRPPTEPPDDTDLDDEGPRNRKAIVVALFALVLGLGIAAMAVFGMLNNNKYAIVCEPDQIVVVQGRTFPPWGTRSIDDDAMWKPIKIPPEAECVELQTEDYDQLSGWYLENLKTRAEALLKTRDVTKTDEAASLLDQALLHARSSTRSADRTKVQHLLGDVQYWRASAKLQQASTALTDAAKQFEAAHAQEPSQVDDAAKWAAHVRKIVEELQAGPAGLPSTTFPPLPPTQPGDRPPAPPGVALPIEPGDAGVIEAPPADAAVVPTGGVLL